MRKQIVMNETQKNEITEAARACNLSVSSFLKMAAKEKINRMGIQINAVQSNNLDSPTPDNQVKGVSANERIQRNV